MGKRGPKPSPEKMAGVSMRMRQETRDALEASATKAGRTLSAEIELRLRQSFSDQERFPEAFGSVRNYRLMQMIALCIESATSRDFAEIDWLDDPAAFDVVSEAISGLLGWLRPDGPPSVLGGKTMVALSAPVDILAEIQDAHDNVPLAANARQHKASRIKASLGHVVKRTNVRRLANGARMVLSAGVTLSDGVNDQAPLTPRSKGRAK